jgi:hypothetical protein
LAKAKGEILDDEPLIQTLQVSKKTSADIKIKFEASEILEKEIN